MKKKTTATPQVLPRGKLAATFGLSEDTPDNFIRMYAGALHGNNQANEIKDIYDTNNPPQPPALAKE